MKTCIADLVPREAVEKWLKYLREELPAVAFKCSTQEQRSNLGWKSSSKAAKPSNLLQTSDCLGAETLIKLLKNYSRSHEVHLFFVFGLQYNFICLLMLIWFVCLFKFVLEFESLVVLRQVLISLHNFVFADKEVHNCGYYWPA